MKKGKIVVLVLAILTALCFGFTGCEEEKETPPPPAPETTGTLVIYNNSVYQQDTITKITIHEGGKSTPLKEETVSIKYGESKTYTLAAGGYTVQLRDNSNGTTSGMASVTIGGTTSLSWNGTSLQ